MKTEVFYLPVASILELAGIMTLLTNESVIGPVDIGFTVPYFLSANLQGIFLFALGTALTLYALKGLQE